MLDYDQTAPTLDNGGRILRAVVRPYPAKTAGIPLRFEYEVNTGDFTFEWVIPEEEPSSSPPSRTEPSVNAPPRTAHPPLTSNVTEIFVPSFLARGSKVVVTGLGAHDSAAYDEARQTLAIRLGDTTPGRVVRIAVALAPRLRPVFAVNDFGSDWGGAVVAAGAVLLAIWAWVLTRWVAAAQQ